MKPSLIFFLVIITVIGAISGCNHQSQEMNATDISNQTQGERAKSEEKTVGVVLLYRRDEFWRDIEYVLTSKAEDYGFKLMISDGNFDIAKQTQQIEDMIEYGVDLIAIAASDPIGILPAIDSCERAGVPVMIFDQPIESNYPISQILFDYYNNGTLTGELCVDFIKEHYEENEEVQIALIDYPKSVFLCVPILNGVVDEVLTLDNVKIVSQQNGNVSRADALGVMENILISEPNVDIVFGVNPETSLGAYTAIKAMGRDDVYVLCFGWSEELFLLMKKENSQFIGGCVNNPHLLASTVLQVAQDYFEGEDVEKYIQLEQNLFDQMAIQNFSLESYSN